MKASSAPTSSEVALLNKIKRQNDEIKKHKEEIKQVCVNVPFIDDGLLLCVHVLLVTALLKPGGCLQ